MRHRLRGMIGAAIGAMAMVTAPVVAATLVFPLAGGITVTITETPFDRTQVAMGDCAPGAARCRIEGRRAFGTIGVPTSVLSGITVAVGHAHYRLDVTHMFNPLLSGPRIVPTEVFNGFCEDSQTCAFRAIFGDAGGSYCAEWHIIDGRVERTVLSDTSDLCAFFRKHLVPPRYF